MWHFEFSQGREKFDHQLLIAHHIPSPIYTDTYTKMASTSAQGLSNGQVSELQQSGDYAIKSESVTPKLGALSFEMVRV
jgi:hypothetical protein